MNDGSMAGVNVRRLAAIDMYGTRGTTRRRDLNMKALLLDTAADAIAAGGVAITGAIILAKAGWYWLDPTVALIIAVVVGYHALRLIRKVVAALKAAKRL
ncbi:MAG: cation transporter [Actinomycetia bacterium]|nr:cation transporter [Actinomycetes bacterium]